MVTEEVLTSDSVERAHPVATETPAPISIAGIARTRNSPSSSPHKLGKQGPKRRRTVSVRKVPSFQNFRERQRLRHMRASNTQESSNTQETLADKQQPLTLLAFKETLADKNVLTTLMKQLHAHSVQKLSVDKVLSDIRVFLCSEQHEQSTPSQLYYMELVDENPDCEETMALVAEDLLDKFETQINGGWVMLVGDGKTYQHLRKIKRQYGNSLEKLLIFPGDWHTLKTYQETIMKAYYSAGLREIAQECGFHSMTLSSLESCSNFKRTHNFLLQAWEALYRSLLQTYSEQCVSFSDILCTIECILS